MRGYGSTIGSNGNTQSAIDVQTIEADTFFDFATRINMSNSIPMLKANLYVNPINNNISSNSVPPISMNSFCVLVSTNIGVDVIKVATVSHTDIIAKDA